MGSRKKNKHLTGEQPRGNVIVKGPDLDFKIGRIVFSRVMPVTGGNTDTETGFEAFTGAGKTIKQKRRK